MTINNEKMQGVMDLLVDSLHTKMNETTIGEVKAASKKAPAVSSKEYDKKSIRDFLTLYKIEYLESHKLLDEATIQTLKGLFHKRELLEDAFKELSLMRICMDDSSIVTRMSELYMEMNEIDAIFQAYHIDFTTKGLESMLLSELNYYETPEEDSMHISIK